MRESWRRTAQELAEDSGEKCGDLIENTVVTLVLPCTTTAEGRKQVEDPQP